MSYSLVTHKAFTGGTNGGTTAATDTTGASLLVMQVSYYALGPTPTVSDSKSNTWTVLTTQTESGSQVRSVIYYSKNPTVGSGHTFTASGTSIFCSFCVQAWSGANTAAPFDQQNGALNTGVTTLATGSVTPGADGELLVASYGQGTNTTSALTIGSGFTISDTNPGNAGVSYGGSMAYFVQGTAGALNPAWSWTGTGSATANIATFKASSTDISFDAASNSTYQTAQSTYSWNHTCTGSNLCLYVGISMLSVAGSSVSSITYNGVGLTFLGAKASVSGAVRTELWRLVASATGTNSIAVTLSASLDSIGNACSFTNVNQSFPDEGFASASATNVGAADATVDVTTVADRDWTIDNVASDDTAITVGSGQTSRNNVTGALGSGAMSTEGPKTPPGTVTMSWTAVDALKTWSTLAIAIRPISASGAALVTRAAYINQAVNRASVY